MHRSLPPKSHKPMKTPIIPLCWTGLVSAFLVPHLSAQTTYSWRAEATDGTWQLADNWWDGVQTATPGGSEILSFDNDVQPTMTNDLVATTRHRILFNSSLTVSRTVSGTNQNLFASSGANPPLVQNSSAVVTSGGSPSSVRIRTVSENRTFRLCAGTMRRIASLMAAAVLLGRLWRRGVASSFGTQRPLQQ